LHVTNPGEKPWIDVTLSWLKKFAIPYENDNYEKYSLFGHAAIEGFDYTVPADWSSAAYPIAAALITQSQLTIDGVDFQDAQGDKELVTLLQEMGAKFHLERNSLTVLPGSSLKGRRIDISRFIDAITILPVIACFAEGKTEIVGGRIARTKECDRIHSIVSELKKMGAKIKETDDGLTIEPSTLYGATLESYHDHRMAMSLSVAGLAAQGKTAIRGIDTVQKSFPGFFGMFQSVGAKIE
ncbi:MAG TPA: 3-phosphoshikimate 1-carboxyvinyltransferase, partial [Candidatus Babeliaceae bacterium]|nr:3-phosphoshikimate 1-carboxyvinyltransferase [Candidatus Babeliaceae bacterium]